MTTTRVTRVIVGVAATAGWMLCLTALQGGQVFAQLGIYGLAVIAAVVVIDWKNVTGLLRPNRRAISIGVGAGLLMSGATYAGYWLVSAWVPAIRPLVQHLFALFWQPPGPVAHLHWLLVIVVAEELLWRGLWSNVTERGVTGAALAVTLYAIGQSGSGSLMVVGLALACGALWTALRLWTRSLWAPLLTHAIWDLLVLVWLPLE